MQIVRTPEARFNGLPDYPFTANFHDISATDGTKLRMHYLDEGPQNGQTILCLHGQPSWSFLYRKMIPHLIEAGHRVIAPDLIGFGKSDKPTSRESYTYAGHVDWMSQWLTGLDLKGLTLVCQDWGGLIGLRLVARHPDRFERLVIANTGLPDSKQIPKDLSEMMGTIYPQIPTPNAKDVREAFGSGAPGAFLYWVKYCADSPSFSVRDVFGMLSNITDERILDGYEAPFPDETYTAGARQFPSLVPLMPHHAADRADNDAAWTVLEQFEKPVLTAFTDDDPVTAGGEVPFQKRIPGAKTQTHVTIKGGGHFLQEGQPLAFSQAINAFIAATS